MIKFNSNVLEILEKEAKKSDVVRSKMSAIVIDSKNKTPFILKAYNHHIFMNIHKAPFSIHAEEHLILKAARYGFSLKNSSIAIYKIQNKTKPTSRPCPMCMIKLQNAGVRWIYYLSNGEWAKEKIQ